MLAAIGAWSLGPGSQEARAAARRRVRPDGTDPRRSDAGRSTTIAPGRSAARRDHRRRHLRTARRPAPEAGGRTVHDLREGHDVGGTWWDNTYPDCRTDVHSHIYTYSFFPHDWPSYFSRQHVIHGYLRRFAEENGLLEHIVFGTEVSRARRWNDDTKSTWRLSTTRVTGSRHHPSSSTVLVSAVGQLNRPSSPRSKGSTTFSGPAFHSAEWDHSVDFTGKRVAVIGTGASALQFAPALARHRRAAHRLPAQRAVAACRPRSCADDIADDERWLLRNLPLYRAYYRFSIFLPRVVGQPRAATVDPDYPPTERAVSAANERLRSMLTDYLRGTGRRPDGPRRQDRPELPAGRQADRPRRRHLGGDPQARQRRPGLAT